MPVRQWDPRKYGSFKKMEEAHLRAEEQKEQAEAVDRQIGQFLMTPDGDQLYRELEMMFQDRGSFSGDPYSMAYAEGQRSVFLFLKSCKEAVSEKV